VSIYDDIPSTKQGVITFRTYAENHIKELHATIKKFEKLLIECDRRIEEMEKGGG
jgi:hypothetical protein